MISELITINYIILKIMINNNDDQLTDHVKITIKVKFDHVSIEKKRFHYNYNNN